MHIRNSHQHENWPFGFHKHHKCDLGSFSETALRWNGDKIETLSYSSKAVMSKNLHFMSSAFKICLHLSWYQSLQSNIVDLIKNWNISHNFLPFLHIIWATYCNFACLFLLLLKTYRRNILMMLIHNYIHKTSSESSKVWKSNIWSTKCSSGSKCGDGLLLFTLVWIFLFLASPFLSSSMSIKVSKSNGLTSNVTSISFIHQID